MDKESKDLNGILISIKENQKAETQPSLNQLRAALTSNCDATVQNVANTTENIKENYASSKESDLNKIHILTEGGEGGFSQRPQRCSKVITYDKSNEDFGDRYNAVLNNRLHAINMYQNLDMKDLFRSPKKYST